MAAIEGINNEATILITEQTRVLKLLQAQVLELNLGEEELITNINKYLLCGSMDSAYAVDTGKRELFGPKYYPDSQEVFKGFKTLGKHLGFRFSLPEFYPTELTFDLNSKASSFSLQFLPSWRSNENLLSLFTKHARENLIHDPDITVEINYDSFSTPETIGIDVKRTNGNLTTAVAGYSYCFWDVSIRSFKPMSGLANN